MRGVSHAELLRTTSAREVGEYRALHSIDPLWDGDRIENAISQLTSLTYNVNRGPDADATSPLDWKPDYAAWITAKTTQQTSDDFDRWYAEQKRKGLVEG